MSIALLPLLALAADLHAGVPTLDGAAAVMQDGRLRVSIATSAPIEKSAVHTKSRARTFMVYVEGARVTQDRGLAGAPLPIAALARAHYAKLEITVAPGLTCAGPASVVATEGTLDVSVDCASAPQAARPLAEAPKVAAAVVAPAPSEAKPVVLAVVAAAPLPSKPAASKAAEPKLDDPPPAHAVYAEAASPARAPLVLPLALLAAALVGVFAWTRRRPRVSRRIRIVETATLGPKRSLILAEINGSMLVLGASEAGITLLTSKAGALPNPFESDASDGAADLATGAEGDGPSSDQVGLLTRLFHREPAPAPDADARTGNPDEDDAFAAMLRESIEDQDLRIRLAGGQSGRVA